MYPEGHYYLLQAIMSLCVIEYNIMAIWGIFYIYYVFTILPVIFPLYLLKQLEYGRWNHHCNTQICKVVCSTIRWCATNKNYYYINVVCIQIVPHWATNQECSINWGIMAFIWIEARVFISYKRFLTRHLNESDVYSKPSIYFLLFTCPVA